jgi:Na+/H+ antiporter NhaD/arsenite permease-like protein
MIIASALVPKIPLVFGIPVDFLLFALILLGVALFHHHTLRVALIGLGTIVIYKILFTGFKTGAGVGGLASHLEHEWVILANLFCLLTGFALLSRHFEKSHVPIVLPRYLPQDWKGAFAMLVMVWVLSSFLDNIAAALIGGAMAQQLFRAKVHIGYLAAIVAASNAGGAWSVVGDTTMMWIDGISPAAIFEAIVASSVALFIFGIPAAIQQQKYSPILQHSREHTHLDWARVGIVGLILVVAIAANVTVNTRFPALADSLPIYRRGCMGHHPAFRRRAPAELGSVAGDGQGFDFSSLPRLVRFHDVGRKIAGCILVDRTRARILISRLRQLPAHRAGHQSGRI